MAKVHVDVEKPRKEEFAGAVDPHNRRRRRNRTSGYGRNSLLFNQYTDVLPRLPPGTVDEGHILDQKGTILGQQAGEEEKADQIT